MGRFPICGRDYRVSVPNDGAVLQDAIERAAWMNLSPEDRLQRSRAMFRMYSEHLDLGVGNARAARSLARSLASIERT